MSLAVGGLQVGWRVRRCGKLWAGLLRAIERRAEAVTAVDMDVADWEDAREDVMDEHRKQFERAIQVRCH